MGRQGAGWASRGPAGDQGDEAAPVTVSIRDVGAALVGDNNTQNNTQIVYAFTAPGGELGWSGGTLPPPLVSVSGDIDSPYRGLSAFGERDAAFFFGREAVTAGVLDRLSALAAAPGLLVLSGVSGAGKSSLLQAGVLPRLRASGLAGLPEAADWPRALITPARAPLSELAAGVAAVTGSDAARLRRELAAEPAGFALTARQAAETAPGRDPARVRRIMLVVDQFEELFTQCADEGERRAFIAALHAAATTGQGTRQVPAALVVLVVRADIEARCADYPELASAVQDRYLLTPMTERQLRLAVSEPARMAGAAADEALVAAVVREVLGRRPGGTRTAGAGVLPLLSHALDKAWRGRASAGRLTLADYDRAGGIEGGITASAERAWRSLTPGQQAAARQIFLCLVTAGADGGASAARADQEELTAGLKPHPEGDVRAVLAVFAAERLVTLGAGWAEISHEVVLSAWPRLAEWLTGDQLDRARYHQLSSDVRAWEASGRSPSYLYAPARAAEVSAAARRWAADPARFLQLTPASAEFLAAARHAARHGTRRRRGLIAALAVLVAVAGTISGAALRYAGDARHANAIVLSRRLADDSVALRQASPIGAGQLALAAYSVYPTSQARSAVEGLLLGQEQHGELPAVQGDSEPQDSATGLLGVAFSPDGHLLAAVGGTGYLRLWRLAAVPGPGVAVRVDPGGRLEAVAFSPDGHLLAAGAADGQVFLLDPATGRPAGRPIRDARRDGVAAVAFSPDGRLLAVAGGGVTRLWDTVTGAPVGRALPAGSAAGVAALADSVTFSPDGHLLAVADDLGYVRLWDPATGRAVGRPIPADLVFPPGSNATNGLANGGGGISQVAFSPDGRLLATADTNGDARLWDTASGQPVGRPLPADPGGQVGTVSGVAFSPDGRLLATGDGDGNVRVWDVATGQPVGRGLAADPGGQVNAVAFSPDGRLLATADSNGDARLWDVATGQPVGAPVPAGPDDSAGHVTFSRDGRLLAIDTGEGVWLWNAAAGEPAASPLARGQDTEMNDMAFSPDGRLLATADSNGNALLWDIAAGQPTCPNLVPGAPDPAGALAFSPDGQVLAVADGDGEVYLWDTRTCRPAGHRLPSGFPGGGDGMAFSPDGHLLAIADGAGGARLWNPTTGKPASPAMSGGAREVTEAVPRPPDAGGGPDDVAFSPDGRILATDDGDQDQVQLWNVATGKPAGQPLPTSGGAVDVAFSPDGRLLATADSSGYAQLWNVSTGRPVGFPLPAASGTGVGALAFSTDGRSLITVGEGTPVRIFPLALFEDPYAALCAEAGPPTSAEWNTYARGHPRPRICGRQV